MAGKKFTNPFRLTVPKFDPTKSAGNISYGSFLAQLYALNTDKGSLFNRDNVNREWEIATDRLYPHDPSRAQALKAQMSGADAKALWARYEQLLERVQRTKGVATSPVTSSLVMPELNTRPLEKLVYEDVVEMMQRANPGVELTKEDVGSYINHLRKEIRRPSKLRRVEAVAKRLESQGKTYWKQRGK